MSAVESSVLCRRPAMNTWFEFLLLGDDSEHLHAVGEAALDEIERIEKLLSRFDPSSEISRINRDAAKEPILIDCELMDILQTCSDAWKKTDGFFDITATRGCESNFEAIELNYEARTIFFRKENVRLDFGAFGKGYALDCAAELIRHNGVSAALLNGGTSSVLAIGNGINEQPWRVGIRNPWKMDEQLRQLDLSNKALSSSATGEDICDARSGKPLHHQAGCSVIAKTAAEAEVFSTALLCMGQERAVSFLSKNVSLGLKVLWAMNPSSPQTIYL